jgi:alkylation response protein AidB-like acyl-CoA dehydrogenase
VFIPEYRTTTTYTGAPIGGFQAVQIKIAEAAVMIDSAIVMAREDCLQAHALAEQGEVPELSATCARSGRTSSIPSTCRRRCSGATH